MFGSSRSTVTATRRRSGVAVLLGATVAGSVAFGVPAGKTMGTADVETSCPFKDSAGSQEDCYGFDMLPDGISIDGCWDCDTDYHFGLSFWCVDVTISCTDSEDNTLTIDVTDAAGLC